MILQSKDEFDKLLEMDADTGACRLISRKEHPKISSIPPSGAFSILNGNILSLYRNHGVLHFSVGNRAVELTDDVTSVLTSENDKRVFQLIRNGEPEIRFTYLPPENDVLLSADPTPFIEAEDFDFLLFVHHVLTETGRRERVYPEQR